MTTEASIWTKMLHYVAWIIALSGVFYGIIVPYFIPDLLNMYLNEFNSNVLFNSITEGPKTMIYFLFGVMGAIMFGWGILLVFMTKRLLIKDEPWIWKAITSSAIGWFVFDSMISLALGTVLNIVFNLAFLDLVMIPIIGYYYSNWKTSKGKNSVRI